MWLAFYSGETSVCAQAIDKGKRAKAFWFFVKKLLKSHFFIEKVCKKKKNVV